MSGPRAASRTASSAAVLPRLSARVTTGVGIAAGGPAEVLELRDIEGSGLDDVLEDLVPAHDQHRLPLRPA